MIERILSGMGGGEPAAERARLLGFRRVLATVIATEYVTKALAHSTSFGWVDGVQVALAVALAAAVLTRGDGSTQRAAFAGIALLQAWWVVQYFPGTGNHRYLELWFAVLLALLDDEQADQRTLLLQALRWSTMVVLIVSGLQKLVHGYWFRGQFLAWSLWREGFHAALAPWIPAAELARLTALGSAPGDGPYRLHGPLLIGLSNLVWISEIGLGLMLIPRATRAFAWVSAVGVIVLAELPARELIFGLEFVAALALFARGAVVRRMVPIVLVVAAWLIAVRLGWLPEVLFH